MQGVEAELFPDFVFTDEHVRDVLHKLRNVDGPDLMLSDISDDPGVMLMKKVSANGVAALTTSCDRPR